LLLRLPLLMMLKEVFVTVFGWEVLLLLLLIL
jgi:hypothetical protein